MGDFLDKIMHDALEYWDMLMPAFAVFQISWLIPLYTWYFGDTNRSLIGMGYTLDGNIFIIFISVVFLSIGVVTELYNCIRERREKYDTYNG